ncbi:ATP-binding cassette domain-containing protein [Candidatus Peregrinibacteria bacterium]|nr:MAG: ATP-binding cassette domain-containing protein [Candidatus Peregrinibacteria bacterium]
MIRFRNISKEYGLKLLFDRINIEIQGGEFVALTGVSGVGKSTLLHFLIGAEKPDSGSVEVDGFHVGLLSTSELQLLRRSMGVIFQDFKLLPRKNVFENVAFAMEVCGNSDAEIEERVPTVLNRVGLSDAQHKFPEQLSGGEQQRVAIARALVHRPSLLLADEPTGNLDPAGARDIGDMLHSLNKEDGITILLSTHNKNIVNTIRPRVLHLKDAKIMSDISHGKYPE